MEWKPRFDPVSRMLVFSKAMNIKNLIQYAVAVINKRFVDKTAILRKYDMSTKIQIKAYYKIWIP